MRNLLQYADELIKYLSSFDETTSCKLYGSLVNYTFDEYSDIDIEVDVSGHDNSIFVAKLPEILARRYPVIFCDYAPSLMPESYIVTVGMNADNPFCIADFKCVATPHCTTLSK